MRTESRIQELTWKEKIKKRKKQKEDLKKCYESNEQGHEIFLPTYLTLKGCF